MTLNCAIIDDEPLALEMMSGYVQKTPFQTLSGAYGSAVQAIRKQFLHILIIIQSVKIYIKIKAVLSK